MSAKILIVEDEFVVANSLRILLKQAGYRVSSIATSAEEAYAILQKDKHDLVLLDIRLNGSESGIDLARKLKAEHIAFVYLSANSSQKVLEEAKKTEPYGFLVKPFREKDLLVALDIAVYLHKNRLESKLRQEALLERQLLEISLDVSDGKQTFLTIARAIRTFIPFDLIVCGTRPLTASRFDDYGYLRVGFDDYQFIGKDELLTISGLRSDSLATLIENGNTDTHVATYNNGATKDAVLVTPLQTIWLNAYNFESYLVFPVALSNGSWVHYSFYSRRRDIYMQSHLAILTGFVSSLTKATEKLVHSDLSSPPTIRLSASGKHDRTTHNQGSIPEFKSIIGKHPLLLAALDLVAQVAPYNTSVLILGESGTGKESIAQAIHSLSARKDGPFIRVNCASIPASLIESELFGHEKGAFTGAIEKRKGKFEQADGGTLFLDEIGEMPLDMQVRLLRVLQEKEIDPVGGKSPRKVDVRIVTATNRNLEREVAEGRFRLDLYYRLNVFPITLPPLRERKSDILALAVYFANRFCNEFNKDFNGISQSMIDELQRYTWPGNIRELENVLERSVILNDGKSELELKQSLSGTADKVPNKVAIETLGDVRRIQRETERDYLISVLKKTKGLIRGANGAAELLNIKPTTLEARLAKLGIQREDLGT
ncbi:Sigma 54 interacting domain protein [Fibrisoma limi BUZ 3]|uniref:Sigma 54 interacting domain protein n=1 Tax=Fibrisoma limi BUZ 3 TaxID=1185876 RepID=I2GFQ2_9BACT|nr:sigma 54-interacting response regulator [Fibrisoma limi]CCH52727.1 Sigma 54 interacting domain protein [Fibrisoma limi BUZ 3]